MAFFGTVEHTLDDKNRIRIPKRFREAFPENEQIYFMKYDAGCIAVYTESALKERIDEYQKVRSDQRGLLNYRRMIYSGLEPIEEDKQGRIMLSASMRAFAGIKKDIITIGMYDYLEIWAPDRLESVQKDLKLEDALAAIPM